MTPTQGSALLPSASGAAVLLAALAVAAGPDGGPFSAAGPASRGTPVIHGLTVASGSSGREGDVVGFQVSASDPDGAPLTIEWDPGDGSPPRTGVGLATLTHRYIDEAPGGQATVKVTVTSTSGESVTRSVIVPVENVAPSIVSMTRDGTAVPGSTLTFRSSVADRGPADAIRYDWDFGDGTTGSGASVTHAFASDGTYTVTLTVDDGDGGTDSRTMSVIVGRGANFSVSGDIGIPDTDVTFLNIVGAPAGDGLCQVRIQLTIDGEAGVGLQTVMRTGLGPGRHRIVYTDDYAGDWTGNSTAIGQVTATFGADRKYDPPGPLRQGFASTGGILDVTSFDGEFLQASFEIRLQEMVVASWGPRDVLVRGALSAPVSGGGNIYLCGVGDEELLMVSASPNAGDVNVDWADPGVAVGFNRPLDPASLAANLVLEMRTVDGSFRAAPGSWMPDPGDPTVARFQPTGSLLEAVVYCVRVRSGVSGIRGQEGEIYRDAREILNATTRPACSDRGRWSGGHVTWAFSTVPTLSGVRPGVYQVHRDSPLIPGKSTLTRIFYDWAPPHPSLAIHDAAQVKWTPVEARVETGEGGYRAVTRVVQRTDQVSTQDSIHARNSVNVFGWRPGPGGAVNVTATLEPQNQSASQPYTFTGGTAAPLGRERYSPDLDVDYYYLEVGSWDAGIPSWAMATGDRLMQDGADFTTSNFPVTTTRARPRGAMDIDDAWFEVGGRRLDLSSDLFVASAVPIAWELLQKAGTTSADVVVGLVPDDILPNAFGVTLHFTPDGQFLNSGLGSSPQAHFSFGTAAHRVVLLRLAPPGGTPPPTIASTVAHELGHFYFLCHTDGTVGAAHSCVTGQHDHQGFRILPGGAGGHNKDEGNPEAGDGRTVIPLMRSGQSSDGLRFMSRRHYEALTSTMQVMAEFAGSPTVAPAGGGAAPVPGDPVQFASLLPGEPVRLASLVPGVAPEWTGRRADGRHASLLPAWPPVSLRQEAAGRLVVSGVIDGAGQVQGLGPTRLEDGPAGPAPPAGIAAPLRVRLLGAAGETLAEAPIAVREAWSHHDGGRAADGVRFFRAELPFDDGAQRWVLDENGRELASFDRSASAPTVRIDPPPSDPRDPFELAWSGSDPDGDPLRYSVHYSADGRSWRALALHAQRSSLVVDPALLEAGPEPALRVTASDGFHRAEARVSVTVRPRLDVWMTWPRPDEPVSATPTIQVVFRGEPVFDVFDARTLTLFMADGNEIPGETVVDEGGRRLVFAPLVPLPPDTEFRVVMRPGLVSTDGARLTEPVSWTFRTGGG